MDKIKGHGFEQSVFTVERVESISDEPISDEPISDEMFITLINLSQDEMTAFLRKHPLVDGVVFANDGKVTDVSTQK